jgi:hypothetical protein
MIAVNRLRARTHTQFFSFMLILTLVVKPSSPFSMFGLPSSLVHKEKRPPTTISTRASRRVFFLYSVTQTLHRDGVLPSPKAAMMRGPSIRSKYFTDHEQTQRVSGKESQKTVSFPMLSSYGNVKHLLDDTMPLLENGIEAGVRPVDAVNMMNRLKQMARDERAGMSEDAERSQRAMVLCAEIAVAGMRSMHSKHVALALNSIKERSPPLFAQLGSTALEGEVVFENLFQEATARALHLLEIEVNHNEPEVFTFRSIPAQTLAIILNSVTAGGRGMVPLFERASAHLQQLTDNSADAHSVASVLNAYAGMDMWDASLFRSMSARVVLMPREGFTLQSVGMILNSYSRFLERTCTWDVNESDLRLFQALALVTRWLCSRQTLRSAATVRSLTLIVNAFAKVGIPDEELFADVALLVESVSRPKGRAPSGLFDSQSVANLMNAYAKAGSLTPSLFALLSAEAKALPQSTLQGQHISNILHAAVKAGHEDKELFMHMSQVLQKRRVQQSLTPQSLTPQSVALVLNAFARGEFVLDDTHADCMLPHVHTRTYRERVA